MDDSWKWQLRDRLGQWMDMDSGVRWLGSGQTRQGFIVGSPKPGVATVQEAGGLKRRVNIPTSRLTAITLPPGKVPPAAKPSVPQIPKSLANLSDRQVEALYWAARDHPDVSIFRWARLAKEVFKRRIALEPHSGGGVPAGVFAAGVLSLSLTPRQMQVRIIERELALR